MRRDTPTRTRRPAARRDRGVSETVGTILMFGVVVLLVVSLQVSAVPVWNQNIEYEHSRRVQGDIGTLRDEMVRAATTDRQTAAAIELGVSYPTRPFLTNPPDPSGTLRTGPPGAVVVENARATGEAGDYWDGSPITFSTRTVTYAPDYNEYGNAPRTVIDNTVVYADYDDAQVPIAGETLVSGRRITLVLVNGSLSRSNDRTANVDVQPVSAPATTVPVRSDTGPVVVRLATTMAESVWRDLLAEQFVENGGHVQSLSVTDGDPYDTLTINLEPGVTYDLRIAKVGLGSEVDDPAARYVTTVSGDGANVPAGDSQRLVVEVRDRFNNPVSGERVTVTVSGGGSVTPVDVVTDQDGRAVFRYDAPTGATEATVTASIGANATDEQRATFAVNVFATGGGGSDGGGGVGTGGVSQWSTANDTRTLSVAGGVWQGLDGVSSLTLSNPKFTPIEDRHGGEFQSSVEYLDLSLVFESGDTKYAVEVSGAPNGLKREPGGKWSDTKVTIWRKTGDAAYTKLGEVSLDVALLESFYQGTADLPLLKQPSYDGSFPALNELRQFLRGNQDVQVHVVEMDGRVTVTAS